MGWCFCEAVSQSERKGVDRKWTKIGGNRKHHLGSDMLYRSYEGPVAVSGVIWKSFMARISKL